MNREYRIWTLAESLEDYQALPVAPQLTERTARFPCWVTLGTATDTGPTQATKKLVSMFSDLSDFVKVKADESPHFTTRQIGGKKIRKHYYRCPSARNVMLMR